MNQVNTHKIRWVWVCVSFFNTRWVLVRIWVLILTISIGWGHVITWLAGPAHVPLHS